MNEYEYIPNKRVVYEILTRGIPVKMVDLEKDETFYIRTTSELLLSRVTKPQVHFFMEAKGSMIDFGKQLRAFRIHAGMSQKELAKQIHVSPGTISQIETGRQTGISPIHVENLSRVFDVTEQELLFGAPGDRR